MLLFCVGKCLHCIGELVPGGALMQPCSSSIGEERHLQPLMAPEEHTSGHGGRSEPSRQPCECSRLDRRGVRRHFAAVCLAAFEMPDDLAPLLDPIVGAPGWSHYVGYDGDEAVTAGALYVEDGLGWLGWGSTLESHRGRGGQSAIFAARMRDARELGCRMVVTETGEEDEQDPVNHSYRNMVRLGFRLAYPRRNWVRTTP